MEMENIIYKKKITENFPKLSCPSNFLIFLLSDGVYDMVVIDLLEAVFIDFCRDIKSVLKS